MELYRGYLPDCIISFMAAAAAVVVTRYRVSIKEIQKQGTITDGLLVFLMRIGGIKATSFEVAAIDAYNSRMSKKMQEKRGS